MGRLDRVRVKAVAEAVARIPLEALDAMERSDPQYRAVTDIVERHGARALAIVVANALVSYRLRVTGEEYWLEYAGWWRQRPTPRTVEELLEGVGLFLETRRLGMHIDQKLSRLRRASTLLAELMGWEGERLSLEELYRLLRARLKAREYEKTVFFAVKMAFYVARALGARVDGVESSEILIPLDSRISLLTSTSGMVRACPREVYTRLRSEAVTAWSEVSRISGVPAVRLDTLMWLPSQGIERLLRRGLLASARDEVARRLVRLSNGFIGWGDASRLALELLHVNTLAVCEAA